MTATTADPAEVAEPAVTTGTDTTIAAARAERVAVAAFVGGALLAGGNAVGIRISLRELHTSPLWAAAMRFALAAGILLVVMAARRVPWPRGRALTGALLYGVLVFGGAYAFIFYALLELQAGFFQLTGALVPLATLLLAVAQRDERLRRAAVVGSVVAVLGVAVMTQASLGGSLPVLHLLAGLGATLCFAQGTIVVRRYPSPHPVAMNAIGMATGAAVLLVGAMIRSEPFVVPQLGTTWAALGYLAVVGSIAVFGLYLVVLEHWSASRAAYGFLLVPIVTVLLSAWLDDEQLTWGLGLGGLLVLAGVYVGALHQPRVPSRTSSQAGPEVSAAEDGVRLRP
jgi:drug/metabolite transporter (DMT)-like permease